MAENAGNGRNVDTLYTHCVLQLLVIGTNHTYVYYINILHSVICYWKNAHLRKTFFTIVLTRVSGKFFFSPSVSVSPLFSPLCFSSVSPLFLVSFYSVSHLFLLCFSSVSSLFLLCFSSVSHQFLLCFSSVSPLFLLWFSSVSPLFLLIFSSVSSLFFLCFSSVSHMLDGKTFRETDQRDFLPLQICLIT